MYGTLYLCATPIGNMEDITLRALRLLRECDIIAAEDTRRTLALLTRYNIHNRIESYHEHNKRTKGAELINSLKEGKSIALVTDAGMPGLSDPGADMVALCQMEGIEVTVAPGATAVVTALVLSGLDTRRFAFEGFLPADKKQRRQLIAGLKNESRTLVLYEAPHRLKATLAELLDALGDRRCACSRELTKRFEEVRRERLSDCIRHFEEHPPRGEFVLTIEGADPEDIKSAEAAAWQDMSVEEHVRLYEAGGMSQKEAMKAAAADRGVSKRDIYSEIHIKKED